MKNLKASVTFIFITILIDAIGIGVIIPVLPDVIRRFSTSDTFTQQYFGYFISVYALMQFFASPLLGLLSDKWGRRPILLVSLFGAGLDYLLMAFAPSLMILFVGRVVSGLLGASYTVAASYMADISTDQNRAQNFGMIGAAFGVGFIAGPMIGGLLGNMGPQAPFVAAAVLSLLNFLFGLLILPESLPKEMRRPVELKNLNPFVSLKKILQRSEILNLIIIFFLINLAGNAHPCIWTLYTELKFGWTPFQVGMSLAFVGFTIALVQGGLSRKIIPYLGEAKSVTVGLWFCMIGFVLFAIANEGWMMYGVMMIFAFSGIAAPSVQSIVSAKIPPQEQGELQGSLTSLVSVAAIIAPLIYTNLFSLMSHREQGVYFPGVAYMAAAVFSLLSLFIYRTEKKHVQTV